MNAVLLYTINFTVFTALLIFLYRVRSLGCALARQIFPGMVRGMLTGLLLKIGYLYSPRVASDALRWIAVISGGYINVR